ncbi:hypothetical protein Q3G72_014499 [Acer saccharum]|nr:hypothetical protein Q3G72_014499 [Acer saccharum]
MDASLASDAGSIASPNLGGVQPNINPEGSAHQPQWSEGRIATDEIYSRRAILDKIVTWQEVKEIEFPILWDVKNEYGETTKDVFRRAHKKLAKEGEKWMKDTANSCMLVSALIATVLFAAAFTVPGGNTNDDKGIPIFLRTNAFTIFAISYALGLFSSLTSLLMFLAIITARYEVEDFLESLPKKLIIGLGSLFVSIAAMIIAFGAALTIALNERWNWVFVPITLLASFPVAIFVMLQLPLFVQMVRSTYGASIFRPWPSRKFE